MKKPCASHCFDPSSPHTTAAFARSLVSPIRKPRHWLAAAALIAALGTAAPAQVPQLINYQGRVAVEGVNFHGSGQFKFALVNIDASTSYWSNDGTSSAGSQPATAVPLTVTKGLYSVMLGDTTLPNMTAIPHGVFGNPDVRLRVWFNDGTTGSQLLTPDQRIAAVGYAITAADLNLPTTDASGIAGVIRQNGLRLFHTYGTQNLFAGVYAGNLSTTGGQNTAAGFLALYNNTGGSSNTALGTAALQANTTGSHNIAIGRQAGKNLSTGDHNIAIGHQGVAGESATIRIGDPANHQHTHLAGVIHGDGSGLTNIPASAVITPPPGMVRIPAGPFTMGADPDGGTTVTATISAFYLAIHEVSFSQWQAVYLWAKDNGYTDLPAGNGKGPHHPVHTVNWYDVVKWCNARSEMENLTPCYTVSGAIYRTGSSNDVVCNWSANGYRLPTEAEWEKAARGGLAGQRFPWGNTISQNLANYRGDTSSYSYDLGPNGFHPLGNDGTMPYTTPVGTFAPNGYGLHDMAGNVWEWCWDWYGSLAGGTDPRGPSSGSNRVARGGSWNNYAFFCRSAIRLINSPGLRSDNFGFRPARSSVP